MLDRFYLFYLCSLHIRISNVSYAHIFFIEVKMLYFVKEVHKICRISIIHDFLGMVSIFGIILLSLVIPSLL